MSRLCLEAYMQNKKPNIIGPAVEGLKNTAVPYIKLKFWTLWLYGAVVVSISDETYTMFIRH